MLADAPGTDPREMPGAPVTDPTPTPGETPAAPDAPLGEMPPEGEAPPDATPTDPTPPPAAEPPAPMPPQPAPQIEAWEQPLWEQAAQLHGYAQQVDGAKQQLDQAQLVDDRTWAQLQRAGLPPEQLQAYQAQYEGWRNYRLQQLRQLDHVRGQVNTAATGLAQHYATARERAQLERVADPISALVLARDAAKRNGSEFPADEMEELLRSYPPNARRQAATHFERRWKAQHNAVRAAARTDDMGPAGGSASNYDRYSPAELYELDFQRLQRRRG